MSGKRIVEVKRRLDGSEQRFDCELVHRAPSLVIVCFRVERSAAGLAGPGGGGPLDSYGFFWRRRAYNCYHMVRPGDGVARWEDEDEVREAVAAGLLTIEDRERIARARAVLERGHRRVVAEARRLLRSLGRLPAGR